MPTTTITFSTAATVTTASVAWSDPANALASDDSDATATLSAVATATEFLRVTAGDFSAIPRNAVITAITVPVECSYSGVASGAKLNRARLVKDATTYGIEDGTDYALTTSDVVNTYSGTTALWGKTLIPRRDLTSTFGAQVSVSRTSGDPVIALDNLSMTITWHRAPGRSRLSSRIRGGR